MILVAATFIQEKHWEFVQGELNALKLSPRKHLIPSVGDQTSSFFTSFSKDLVKRYNVLERLFDKWKKIKAGPQN